MITTKQIQQVLISLGYSVGPTGADGDMGRNTIAAISKFQKDKKLSIINYGSVGPKTLKALGLDETDIALPPWVELGYKKKGLREKLNNKELREFLKSDGDTLGDPAVLPWCGDFQETIIALTLPKEPMIENPYWAANWLKFGVPVNPSEYYIGAIGVKKRTGGNHVFTIVGHDKTYVHALGGNQNDSISIVKIAKRDITGMRFPKTYPFPTKQMPFTEFNGEINASEA